MNRICVLIVYIFEFNSLVMLYIIPSVLQTFMLVVMSSDRDLSILYRYSPVGDIKSPLVW